MPTLKRLSLTPLTYAGASLYTGCLCMGFHNGRASMARSSKETRRASTLALGSQSEKTRCGVSCPFTLTEETLKPGDVTGEGDVDKNDITAIVQLIMTGQYDEKADLNGDKKVDAADIVTIVNTIMGK